MRAAQRAVSDWVTFLRGTGDELIYILGIQEHSTKKAKVPALTQSLKTMAELARVAGIDRVGLPRIGTGSIGRG